MHTFDAHDVARLTPFGALVDAIRQQFREGCQVPQRHHHTIPVPDGTDATLLLMPAFQTGAWTGVKIVNVFPDNHLKSLPSVMADYLLYDGQTGELRAMMDGATLTARRTAAASALGASYLARENASRLLVVGSGKVARHIPAAYKAVRDIQHVHVWSRMPENAQTLCDDLAAEGVPATVARDLESAVRESDIVSCATLSRAPLVKGEWLSPGQHLDLIGSFTPDMRETDDTALEVCDVFVDTLTALKESGDLAQPLLSGKISEQDITASLEDLCLARHPGRQSETGITLFKSVGAALYDIAAARLAFSSKMALN